MNTIFKCLVGTFGIALIGLFSTSAAKAQIYVANPSPNNSVGEYTLSGAPNGPTPGSPALITGLGSPDGLALEGTDLFVEDSSTSTVGEYILNSNGTVASSVPSFATGITGGAYMIASGNNLYISSGQTGANSTSGVVYDVNISTHTVTTLVSGLNSPTGLAVSGNTLFVASSPTGTNSSTPGVILTYNLTNGGTSATAGSSFGAAELDNPSGITVLNGNLYIANRDGTGGNSGQGTFSGISEFTLSGGLVTENVLPNNASLDSAYGLTASGQILYYTTDDSGNYTIGQYNTSTNTQTTLVTGTGTNSTLYYPEGIAVNTTSVPEPSMWALMLGGLGLLCWLLRVRRSS